MTNEELKRAAEQAYDDKQAEDSYVKHRVDEIISATPWNLVVANFQDADGQHIEHAEIQDAEGNCLMIAQKGRREEMAFAIKCVNAWFGEKNKEDLKCKDVENVKDSFASMKTA